MQLNTLIRYMLERVFKKLELRCQFQREQIQKHRIRKIKQFFVSKTQQTFPLLKEWTLKCTRFVSEEKSFINEMLYPLTDQTGIYKLEI